MPVNFDPKDLTFFTNDENDSLLQRFKRVLHGVKELDILVGYFRMSGFKYLWEEFEDIDNIRILIGMNIGKKTFNAIQQTRDNRTLFSDNIMSSKVVKEKFNDNLIKEITYLNESYKNEEALLKFIEYLKNNKIEIRAYPDSLHAKVYIMNYMRGTEEGKVLTGSSNFTHSGLEGQKEFNVELKYNYDYKFAKTKFNELWENSVDITDEFVETTTNKTWLRDDITPYELYLKTLYEYFKEDLDLESGVEGGIPGLELKYQKQAVVQAKKMIQRHNGVFLADVVGLGKTYISAMLAKELPGKTKKLIVCPPALKEYWEDTLRDFGISGTKVISLGMLDNFIEKYLDENGEHDYDYIFIDEAHRFRNESTQRFEDMHQICFGNKVILVSATPFNNRISDIYTQLKLFQIPRNSTIPGEQNLKKFFDERRTLLKKYKDTEELPSIENEVSKEVRDKVLKHVMIRRTRAEIKDIYKSDFEKGDFFFPTINDPKQIVYRLTGNVEKAFYETINIMTDLEYARYKPLIYLKQEYKNEILDQLTKQSQKNTGGFMKTLIIKRFESSFYAFKKTLSRFIKSYKRFIDMYKSGYIYVGKNVEVYDLWDNDNIEKLMELVDKEEVERYKADKFEDSFLKLLEHDLASFNRMYNLWENINNDPKLDYFKNKLMKDDILKNNKLIVFTESTETGEYLYHKLEKKYGNNIMSYSSSGGFYQGTHHSKNKLKKIVQQNYDPNSNKSENDIRILITTDVLAEGINLHRSNVVINYDLPWNPTKIMQRVGRVNRVGTKFRNLYIYNFFPATESDSELNLEENITHKIQLFHNLLGADAKYLTDDEKISQHGLFGEEIYQKAKDIKNMFEEESESELKYLKIIKDIKDKNPILFKKIKKLPLNIRVFNDFKDIEEDKLLSYIRKGDVQKFYISDKTSTEELTFLDAMYYIKCDDEIESQPRIDIEKFYNLIDDNLNEFKNNLSLESSEPNFKGNSDESKIIDRLEVALHQENYLTDTSINYIKK